MSHDGHSRENRSFPVPGVFFTDVDLRRKLNLTESAGQELVSLLQAGEESKSGVRAEQFLRTGTVTSVSWLVHWSEVLRCLHSGRDLQSPLFQV